MDGYSNSPKKGVMVSVMQAPSLGSLRLLTEAFVLWADDKYVRNGHCISYLYGIWTQIVWTHPPKGFKQEPRKVAGFFVSPYLSLHSTVRKV